MSKLKEYKLNYTLDTIPAELDEKDKIIYEMLEESANDSNSSKFREDATKWMVGLEASEGKHGYDDDFEPIEVKPKNFTGKSKINGGGQFTDFTWKRDAKYHDDKVIMLISGFYYGKLLFVVEFKYDEIRPRIQEQLTRLLPNGDEPNRYVRSASFTYKHWKDNYELKYISPNIEKYKSGISGPLFNLLTQ